MKAELAGKNTGQSIIEVIIALAIVVITISTVMTVSLGNRGMLADTRENTEAIRISKEALEETTAQLLDDFFSPSSSTSSEGIYTSEIIIEDIDSNTKKVTSRTTWDTDPQRDQKVELVSIITNRNVSEETGGDTGGGGISGDWRNPRTLGSIDLGPGNSATDLDAVNKIVYMSAEASAQSKPDFFIVDASNGELPVISSQLDVGKSLRSLDVADNYAFTGGDDTNAQLKVINVANQGSPSLSASFKLPGVSGSGAIGNSIFFHDDKIYMGTKSASGPEFHVIDVVSPTNPSSLGSFEVGVDVNAIFIRGDYAYLATSHENQELKVLNISNPAAITTAGSYDHVNEDDGLSISVAGSDLYLGKYSGYRELVVLDITDPSPIENLGDKEIDASINALVIRDYLAFLGTNESNNEFQVWNIEDPLAMSLWSSFNFPQVVTGMDYEDNLVYVSVRSNDALRIITSQ